MSIVGEPNNWVALIDSFVPDIIRLVIASWEGMSAPAADAKEDHITMDLCRKLRQNRSARELPFIARRRVGPAPFLSDPVEQPD